MTLQGLITFDTTGNTSNIVFSNSSTVDSITYSNTGISYPISSSFTLSQSDFELFYNYKSQFYNTLLSNFPSVFNPSFNAQIPISLMEIKILGDPNVNVYKQTSTDSPVTHVYTITYDRETKIASFARRLSAITITYQEYLQAFQILTLYAKQIAVG